ncbi:hypothetical protein HanRHA438_Chr09g0375791 [Helianthus annuus]|nr:hypothetical protein HanRHA438_Chr09g0375791 [Helianthus annuus]
MEYNTYICFGFGRSPVREKKRCSFITTVFSSHVQRSFSILQNQM